jgi:hypothetical protein
MLAVALLALALAKLSTLGYRVLTRLGTEGLYRKAVTSTLVSVAVGLWLSSAGLLLELFGGVVLLSLADWAARRAGWFDSAV